MTFYISALLMLLSLAGATTLDLSKSPYLVAFLVIGTVLRCVDFRIKIGPFNSIPV